MYNLSIRDMMNLCLYWLLINNRKHTFNIIYFTNHKDCILTASDLRAFISFYFSYQRSNVVYRVFKKFSGAPFFLRNPERVVHTRVVTYISGLKTKIYHEKWFFKIFSIKFNTLLHPFEPILEALQLLLRVSKIVAHVIFYVSAVDGYPIKPICELALAWWKIIGIWRLVFLISPKILANRSLCTIQNWPF